jgi:hypothetical protein
MEKESKDLQEFIALYERGYGERLPDDEAAILMYQLLHLYRTLVRKPPQIDGD